MSTTQNRADPASKAKNNREIRGREAREAGDSRGPKTRYKAHAVRSKPLAPPQTPPISIELNEWPAEWLTA